MESFSKSNGVKGEQYAHCIEIITSLIQYEKDDIANMANIAAVLSVQFEHHWIGFYRVVNDALILGPFQGPLACTRIPKAKGVCGIAFSEKTTQIVPNVHLFPGHIACSGLSNSEIVIPVFRNKEVIGVLDIDSLEFDTFDEIDANNLEIIAQILGENI